MTSADSRPASRSVAAFSGMTARVGSASCTTRPFRRTRPPRKTKTPAKPRLPRPNQPEPKVIPGYRHPGQNSQSPRPKTGDFPEKSGNVRASPPRAFRGRFARQQRRFRRRRRACHALPSPSEPCRAIHVSPCPPRPAPASLDSAEPSEGEPPAAFWSSPKGGIVRSCCRFSIIAVANLGRAELDALSACLPGKSAPFASLQNVPCLAAHLAAAAVTGVEGAVIVDPTHGVPVAPVELAVGPELVEDDYVSVVVIRP